LGAAADWAGERGLEANGDLTYQHEPEHVVLARLLLAQGKPDEAGRLLARLLELAIAGGRITRAIEMLNLQALALRAAGDAGAACRTLERALSLGGRRGFIRIFVDEGPPMERLISDGVGRGIRQEYARRLLAAFPQAAREGAGLPGAQPQHAGMVEPLSGREVEVLQLIAEGLANREVADRLYLSLNTIKVHTRNLYGKLGVKNRTQAVAEARSLGILPRT
jgi:LuxR family maltose regulon positive regulatory protein